jgi:hypothetical protein
VFDHPTPSISVEDDTQLLESDRLLIETDGTDLFCLGRTNPLCRLY